MAVCGAGCMGFVNVARGLRAIGYVEPDPLPSGPVALVTHSGSVFSALLRTRRGFGFSLAVSSGQELVTTAADYARYALELAETKVLALVLEAIRDAPGLRAVLADALAADVPVVLLSVGASKAGQALVSAHSGALAAADGAWEALAGAYGLHRVRDLAELADTLELFASGRRAAPGHGHRDRARLRAGTRAHRRPGRRARRAVRPPHPADAHPAGRGARPGPGPGQPAGRVGDRPRHRAAVRRVPVRAGRRPGRGRGRAGRGPGARVRRRRVLPAGGAGRGRGHGQAGRGAGRAARRRRPGRRGPAARGRDPGPRGHPHRPARAAPPARLCSFPGRAPARRRPPRTPRARPRSAGAPGSPTGGAALFDLLRDYGIPAVRTRAAATRAQALAAADEIGYPVVVKTDEPGIAHKSDVGGVRLGLAGPAAAGAAYDDLAARLGPRVAGVPDRRARHRTGPGRRPGSRARSPPGDQRRRRSRRDYGRTGRAARPGHPVCRPGGACPAPDRPGAGREPRPARRRPRRDRRRHHRPVPPGLRPGRHPRGPRHQPPDLHPRRRPSRRRPPDPPPPAP